MPRLALRVAFNSKKKKKKGKKGAIRIWIYEI